jgi:hypothetical protein
MAASKKGRSRKAVSLGEEDRRYLTESMKRARARGAAGAESEGGLFEALERFGLGSDRVQRLRASIDKMDVRESVDKAQEYLAEQIESARDYAKENPGKVIAGSAGVLVGASLLAIALSRATGQGKRRTSRKRSTASKKSSSRKRSSRK